MTPTPAGLAVALLVALLPAPVGELSREVAPSTAKEDPEAPVQVRWKRRITGPYGGFGSQGVSLRDGRLRVGGEMEISTTPNPYTVLTLDEVRLLVAHEFGHVLGLGHCLDCNSAMNYAWHTASACW